MSKDREKKYIEIMNKRKKGKQNNKVQIQRKEGREKKHKESLNEVKKE